MKSISCLIKRACPPDEPASDSAAGVISSSRGGLLTAFCVCENSRQLLRGSFIQACNTKLLPMGTCWGGFPGGPGGKIPNSSGICGDKSGGGSPGSPRGPCARSPRPAGRPVSEQIREPRSGEDVSSLKSFTQRGRERKRGRRNEVWGTFPKLPAHLLFFSFIPQNRKTNSRV